MTKPSDKFIYKKNIRLVFRGKQNQQGDPAFLAGDGNDIFISDMIEWDTHGTIFPTGGIVSNYSALKVSCFNQILNKWEHYLIV